MSGVTPNSVTAEGAILQFLFTCTSVLRTLRKLRRRAFVSRSAAFSQSNDEKCVYLLFMLLDNHLYIPGSNVSLQIFYIYKRHMRKDTQYLRLKVARFFA